MKNLIKFQMNLMLKPFWGVKMIEITIRTDDNHELIHLENFLKRDGFDTKKRRWKNGVWTTTITKRRK